MRPLAILAVALAMTASPALAQGHGNFHGGHGGWHGGDHHPGGSGFWPGAILGGIIGSMIRPNTTVVVPAEPEIQPWTDPWYRNCAARYRSFDSRTGLWTDYQGIKHFCAG